MKLQDEQRHNKSYLGSMTSVTFNILKAGNLVEGVKLKYNFQR